jgi:hypothetical protein
MSMLKYETNVDNSKVTLLLSNVSCKGSCIPNYQFLFSSNVLLKGNVASISESTYKFKIIQLHKIAYWI